MWNEFTRLISLFQLPLMNLYELQKFTFYKINNINCAVYKHDYSRCYIKELLYNIKAIISKKLKNQTTDSKSTIFLELKWIAATVLFREITNCCFASETRYKRSDIETTALQT